MQDASLEDTLEALNEELVLAGRTESPDYTKALDRALNALEVRTEQFQALRQETRVRLALHLAPREAVRYDPANPVARHILIREYLVSEFQRPADLAGRVAREVQKVLDAWDEPRGAVSAYRDALAERDGDFCQHCRVHFDADPETIESIRISDPFKPYSEDLDKLYAAEVDHVEPVSGVGRNSLANLQLLCVLCNRGKGDGLGISLATEAASAGCDPRDVPPLRRGEFLYWVIERDNRRCSVCANDNSELTIRLRRATGGLVRSNLETVCYACRSTIPPAKAAS